MAYSMTSNDVDGKAHRHRPTIGLALGGGGARGLAHILAFEVFDEMNIRPDVISGTSIGAVMGAAYASGLSGNEIREFAREKLSKRGALFRELISKRGAPLTKMLGALQLRSAFLKADALLELVIPPDMTEKFEDLATPLRIVATDFHEQTEVIFSSGLLRPAVAASMAVPVIMSPVVYNGLTLLDGGLVNPLPYDVIAGEVDIVVAINVLGGPDAARQDIGISQQRPSVMRSLVGSSQILQRSIVREKLKLVQPDILIEIDTGKYHAADFMKLDKILEAAAPVKDELRRKLTRVLGAQTLAAVDDVVDVGDGAHAQAAAHERDGEHPRLAERLMGSC